MKKLSICSIAVLSALSYSVYADDGRTNERSWIEGDKADGTFTIIEEKIVPMNEEEKKNTVNYRLTATTQNYYARHGHNVSMQGQHSIDLYNTSNQTLSYTITMYLCVLNVTCYNQTYNRTLGAGMHYYNSSASSLNYIFPYTGYYNLQAGTRVTGATQGLASDNKSAIID